MSGAPVTLPRSRGSKFRARIGRYSDRLGAVGPIIKQLEEAGQ